MRVKCQQFSGRPLSNTLYPDIFLTTLDAGGRVVPAHRIVLASLSSTARRMLEVGRVRPRNVVTLRLPSFEDLTCLVKFVYTGSLKVKDKNSLQALRTGLQMLGVVGTFKGDVQDILTYVAEPCQVEIPMVQRTGLLDEDKLETRDLEILAIENMSMDRKKPSNSVVAHILNTPVRKRKNNKEEMNEGQVPRQFLPLLKKIQTGSLKVGEEFSVVLEKEELKSGDMENLAIENMSMERKKPSNSLVTHTLNITARKRIKNKEEVNQGKVPHQSSLFLKKIKTSSQNVEDFSSKKALPIGWVYQDSIPASQLLPPSPLLRLGRRPYSLSRPLLKSTRMKKGQEDAHQGKAPSHSSPLLQKMKTSHQEVGGDSPNHISLQPTAKKALPVPAILLQPPSPVMRPRPRSKTLPQGPQVNFKPVPGEDLVFSNVRSDSVKVQCKLCSATPTMTEMRIHVAKHQLTITQYKEQYGSTEPIQRIYHACVLCGDPVLLDSDEISKHLRLVAKREKHGDTKFKDYNERFLVDAV